MWSDGQACGQGQERWTGMCRQQMGGRARDSPGLIWDIKSC
jgi:hypothetical protein